MNHGRTRKEMKRDRESHYEGLAECTPDQKARVGSVVLPVYR